jgi:circadian clock protein KaiC
MRISQGGIVLGHPLQEFQGVLRGVPIYLGGREPVAGEQLTGEQLAGEGE